MLLDYGVSTDTCCIQLSEAEKSSRSQVVDFEENGAAHAQMVDVDVILFPYKGGKNFCLS